MKIQKKHLGLTLGLFGILFVSSCKEVDSKVVTNEEGEIVSESSEYATNGIDADDEVLYGDERDDNAYVVDADGNKIETDAADSNSNDRVDSEVPVSGDTTNETTMDNESSEKSSMTAGSIVEVASNNQDFSTLVTAVKAAGLAEVLGSDGSYTVFAPTNSAFNQLPNGKVDELLKPENKSMLQDVLRYHVVPSKVSAAALVKNIELNDGSFVINTLEGGELIARLEGTTVTLTDFEGSKFKVVKTDIPASNGIVHVIDGVALPNMAEEK